MLDATAPHEDHLGGQQKSVWLTAIKITSPLFLNLCKFYEINSENAISRYLGHYGKRTGFDAQYL